MKKILLILLPLVIGMTSCKNEGTNLQGDERVVEMKLSTQVKTYAPGDETAAEKALNDLTLFVFDGDQATSKLEYTKQAWKKTGSTDTFTTNLKVASGVTIYFAANVKSFIEALPAGTLDEGMTYAEVLEVLVMGNANSLSTTNGLPMWGSVKNVDIKDIIVNDLGSVKLLRSVASADVFMQLTDPAQFELQKGHLVFAPNKGYLPYNDAASNMDGDQVKAPWAPTGMATTVDIEKPVGTSGKDIAYVFYMYENNTPLTNNTTNNRPTRVILEGVYANGKGTATFYPLVFKNASGDQQMATRNNKYVMIITNVNGDGYDTIDEAKNAAPMNVEYKVIPYNVEKDDEIYFDGPRYVLFKGGTYVEVGRSTGDNVGIRLDTNFTLADFKLKLNSTDTGAAVVDTHPRFKAEVKEGTDASNNKFIYLLFTAKQDYGTTDNPATFILEVGGRLSIEVDVRQMSAGRTDWTSGNVIDVEF